MICCAHQLPSSVLPSSVPNRNSLLAYDGTSHSVWQVSPRTQVQQGIVMALQPHNGHMTMHLILEGTPPELQ